MPGPMLRKLDKLRRDPVGFARDMLLKRVLHRRPDPPPLEPTSSVRRPALAPGDRPFDLALFRELNEEYRPAPVLEKAPRYDPDSLERRAAQRVDTLGKLYPLVNARVLEVGCGHAEVTRAIASIHPESQAVGIDVLPRDSWSRIAEPNARVLAHDLGRDDPRGLGTFDFIFAITVWEHVERPYAALRSLRSLLADHGVAYLTINLYRGSQASHLYRDVYFPWPHLLFPDEVFREYYRSIDKPPRAPAWVNKLVAEQYLTYFDELGLHVLDLEYRTAAIDEAFYRRFEYELGKYPRRDLEREYLEVVLTPSRLRRLTRAVGLS